MNSECVHTRRLKPFQLLPSRWQFVQLGNPYGNSNVAHFLYPSIANVGLFFLPSVMLDCLGFAWWCTPKIYVYSHLLMLQSLEFCLSWGKLDPVSWIEYISTKQTFVMVAAEHMIIWMLFGGKYLKSGRLTAPYFSGCYLGPELSMHIWVPKLAKPCHLRPKIQIKNLRCWCGFFTT